LEKD
jgi:hypothetical protein